MLVLLQSKFLTCRNGANNFAIYFRMILLLRTLQSENEDSHVDVGTWKSVYYACPKEGKPFSKFLLHGTEVKPESFIQENGYSRYLWHKSMNSWHEFLPLNIIQFFSSLF